MDHNRIKNDEVIERYVLGQLSPSEEAEFEAHYFECDTCFQEVRLLDSIRESMNRGIETKVLAIHNLKQDKRFPFLGFFRTIAFRQPLAVAASVLVILLIYPSWRGMVAVPELERSIEQMQRPQANVETVFLQQVRSGRPGEKQIVTLETDTSMFVLNFNILEKRDPNSIYRGEILDSKDRIVWEVADLRPHGDYEVFSIACRGEFFGAGDYVLRVLKVDPKSSSLREELSFPFSVLKRET
jgi:hypothetical protein